MVTARPVLSVGSPANGLALAGRVLTLTTATTATITLYVDAATGSDSNPGTALLPFLTISAALAAITATRLEHACVINVAAGTYNETFRVCKDIGAGTLTVQGGWSAFTPSTGVASGTFASTSGQFATVTAAGWTVSNLRGRFLQVTSGSASGSYWPIIANTATTVEIVSSADASALSGATFALVTPSAIVKGVGSAPWGAIVTNTNSTGAPTGSSFTNTPGVILKYLDFSGPSTGANYGVYAEQAAVGLISCRIAMPSTSAGQVRCLNGVRAGIEVTDCYLSSAANNTLSTLRYSQAHYNGCALVSTNASRTGSGLVLYHSTVDLTFNNGISCAGLTNGLTVQALSSVGGKVIGRNCTQLIAAFSGSINLNWGIEANDCGYGILIQGSGSTANNSHVDVSVVSTGQTGAGFNNCTAGGIVSRAPCTVRVNGVPFVGNAVHMKVDDDSASFCSFAYNAACTFSGASAGDFSLDGGVTYKSNAEVVAATGTNIARLENFSRVFRTAVF